MTVDLPTCSGFREPGLVGLYVFYGFGARGARNSTFSFIFSPPRAPKEPPGDPPGDLLRTSGRSVRWYVFMIFMKLGGGRAQIGKFNDWGGFIIEGGG